MLIDDFALISLSPIVAAFMMCKLLSRKQPKLMRSHLIKLGIYEFIWVLYGLGLMGVFALAGTQENFGSTLGVVMLLIMTVSGLALMSILGIGMGARLKSLGQLVTHQDKTLLTLNILLLVSMLTLWSIN